MSDDAGGLRATKHDVDVFYQLGDWMTLIIALATPRFVIHVGDRLITMTDGRRFDSASNKCLIYQTKDAIVSIGYCGLAYLENIPTDQWIAQKLWGPDFLYRAPGRLAAHGFGSADPLDIGRALERLRSESEAALQRDRSGSDRRLQVLVSGWQWGRRGRPRPILNRLRSEITSGKVRCLTGRLDRYWHYTRIDGPNGPTRPLCLAAIPSGTSIIPNCLRGVQDRISTQKHLPQILLQACIDELRHQAKISAAVGPDCIWVYLPHSNQGTAQVGYVAQDVQPTIEMEYGQFSATYSPWLIGEGSYHTPTIMIGSQAVRLGPIDVRLDGGERSTVDGPTLVGASISQKRPSKP